MKIIIAGGGTAGHIYPAISIADALSIELSDIEIIFVGKADGPEAEIVSEAGYEFYPIEVKGLKRKLDPANFLVLIKAAGAFSKLRQYFKKVKPDAVVGTGGYVSAPAVFAAYIAKIPTLIHEQNSVPGLANKILGRLVDVVASSFPNGEEVFPRAKRVVFTGNPIRRQMIGAVREKAAEKFNLAKDKKTLLIFGGSQGSKKINDSCVGAYEKLRDKDYLQILHITGKKHFSQVCKKMRRLIDTKKDKLRYQAHPYLSNINQAFAAADLCISRAGATTIAEITALGVASVLVPYPFATNNHQEKNARYLENHGAARVVLDKELTADVLCELCNGLLNDSKALIKMKNHAQKLGKPFAANDIAKLIEGLSHELDI